MSRQKKALLVGSSFSAAPIYFELKKRGLNVSVCGGLKQDPCHQYADRSIYVDYSDREQLLEVVERDDFDYLVPTCNDYSYLSTCWVAQELGFPGFDNVDVTEVLHTKDDFRRFTDSHGIRAPRRYAKRQFEAAQIEFPCLVKPVDAFSGRGVARVDRRDDLDLAIDRARNASRGGDYVIEQYVSGALHSHSAFMSDGRIVLDFFVDEFCTVYPFQVNCSNHPSSLSLEVKTAVRSEIEKIAGLLQLADGLLHTQFMSNGSDFWVIECMRRCPGDLYGHLIERSTGVDYAGMFVSPFLGQKYRDSYLAAKHLPYGRHTISTARELVYFSFVHKIPAEVEVIQLKNSGEVLGPAPEDKLAIVFFPFRSTEMMLEITPNLAEMISIESPGD